MNSKDKLIISKLVKLARNQQKILEKLAQMTPDPNIEYLKNAWTTAAVNSGVTTVATPEVEFTPGKDQDNVQIGETYTIYADGIPSDNELRKKLMDTFKTQVKSQKPDLDGKLGIIFGKKP